MNTVSVYALQHRTLLHNRTIFTDDHKMQTKSTKTKETNVYGNYVTPHTFAAFKAITHTNAQMKRKGHKEAINQDRREKKRWFLKIQPPNGFH